jgi:hypothetical protein
MKTGIVFDSKNVYQSNTTTEVGAYCECNEAALKTEPIETNCRLPNSVE